ncbi:MAG: Metallophosphoesterase, partial [Actinomycetia bacterium]|nr:Metallophosphoesterase [Actinomycetes bacterium]
MIRIGAVGDVHLGEDTQGQLRPALENVGAHADVLLLAGDLTRHGTAAEGRIVASEVGGLPVPVVAVLGNHDYHSDQQEEITAILGDAGVHVLEGSSVVLPVN